MDFMDFLLLYLSRVAATSNIVPLVFREAGEQGIFLIHKASPR